MRPAVQQIKTKETVLQIKPEMLKRSVGDPVSLPVTLAGTAAEKPSGMAGSKGNSKT